MTTNATVARSDITHPRLLAGAIAATSIAVGIVIGLNLAAIAAPSVGVSQPAPIARPGSAPGNPYVNIYVPVRAPQQIARPGSAPGNPYVNIYAPVRAAQPIALPSSAPGNPYANIYTK
jgi:hypothetical protein